MRDMIDYMMATVAIIFWGIVLLISVIAVSISFASASEMTEQECIDRGGYIALFQGEKVCFMGSLV